jgi:AcrR family transcriptional regulator
VTQAAKIALAEILQRVHDCAVVTATDAELGLRERKKRARRGAIVDAAQALVLQHGLDAVTVDAIAEAAGISTRTFFNYFDSKDDAVLGLAGLNVPPDVEATFVAGGPTGRMLPDLEVLVAGLLGGFAGSEARAHRGFELLQAEPRLLARQFAWMDAHRSGVVALFERRRANRPFAMDPELLAMLVFVLIRSASVAWERSDHEGDVVDHLSDVVEQLTQLARHD